jgi:hypothetical protein
MDMCISVAADTGLPVGMCVLIIATERLGSIEVKC